MYQSDTNREEATMGEDTPFQFSCHENLPCFTQCCRDVNIYLTPYDILRLRRTLKMSSGEVLAKYTRHFLARTTNIPVVQLLMDPDTLNCKLVTQNGCTVYKDRPWACRMFPLDLTQNAGRYRLIVGGERCMGLKETSRHTVGEWLHLQEIEPYVSMENIFQGVMPETFKPGAPMSAGLGKILFLAYDLDRFAELLKDIRFKKFYDVDDETLRRVQEDDEELLKLAFRYIRSQMDELYQVS